jgi:Lrp/AsnC family transcriptional regulator for asnA, asnC and gidA
LLKILIDRQQIVNYKLKRIMNMQANAIDEIDIIILNTLRQDARASLKDIASKCNINSSAVVKRINKLKSSGIIIGTHVVLEPGTLGYPQEATIGITAETGKIDDIIGNVKLIPNVIVCAKSVGRYNLFAHVFARDLAELDNVTHAIKSIHGIRATSVNIHIEKCMIGNHNSKNSSKTQKDKSYKPDEKDFKIVDELLIDAEAPFEKIGNKLGLSHETVRQRYERMKKEGIIKCTLIVDGVKAGYQGTAFFLIACSEEGSKEQTVNSLEELQVFKTIDKVMGGAFDIFAATTTKDLRDLCGIVDKIQRIPTVENVETGILLFTYYAYIPKPGSTYKCDAIGLS